MGNAENKGSEYEEWDVNVGAENKRGNARKVGGNTKIWEIRVATQGIKVEP